MRLLALRFAAGVLQDADGDRRLAARVALSQPVNALDGADENQDQHVADGSGGELQQAAAAQRRLFPGTAGNQPGQQRRLPSLLRLCREAVVRLQKTESALTRLLACDPLQSQRVERLMSIPAISAISLGYRIESPNLT